MNELKEAIEKVIELLPDWASKKHNLVFLSDQELVFKYNERQGLKLKTVRCNHCSACCLDVPENHLPFGTNGEGRCNALGDNGDCTAGHARPFSCLEDPVETEFEELECCIRY
jgi:hypothetical protein